MIDGDVGLLEDRGDELTVRNDSPYVVRMGQEVRLLPGNAIGTPTTENEITKLMKDPASLALMAVFGVLIAPVCEALGNTPAIARKSYIHPALIEAAQGSGLPGGLKLPRRTKYLSAVERGLIEFLEAATPSEQAKAA